MGRYPVIFTVDTQLIPTVRAWREYLELSQEAAAERIGVSRAAYAQMESPRANLRVSTLGKISRAFGVPLPLLVVEGE